MKEDLSKIIIEDFGNEWETYNQNVISEAELETLFNYYFVNFPFNLIGKNSIGFDMGCGSGRWAKLMAPKVKSFIVLSQAKGNRSGKG